MLQNNVKLTDKGFAVGRRAENIVTEVTFDITELIATYGAGTAVLMFKRPYDENAYPVTVEQSGNTVTWIPTNTDLYYDGTGAAELFWYLENDALAKSIVWRVFVARDIGAASGEAPEPYDDWVETLTALGAETLENAQAAQAAQGAAEFAQGKAEDAQGFAEEAATAAGLSAADADRSEGEAAAWATGSYSGGGGIPVPPTAPQHHNNAKYYSEQAEAALEQFTTPTASASTLPAGSSATASYSDGNFAFGIPKGDKGDTGNPGATGPAAGFGAVSATVDSSVGTPSVEVSASGPDTAKQLAFAFHNLKGEQGEQGEPGEVTNEDLWDILPTDSASGAIASFSDGAKNVPLKSLVVDIDPVQDLHGYANPWPAGGGVNKLDPTKMVVHNASLYGLTVTISNDGIVNLSGSWTGATSGGARAIDVPNAVRSYNVKAFESTNHVTARWQTGEDVIVFDFSNMTNGNTYNLNVGIVIYEGSTAPTAWTPYSNLCPISGWTGATVTRTGKNLFDKANVLGGYINSAGKFTASNAGEKVVYAFLRAGTYYYSKSVTTSLYRYCIYDSMPVNGAVGSVISSNAGINFCNFTLTKPSYFAAYCYNNNGETSPFEDVLNTIQIERGSTASSYEPYAGQTYPITWQTEAGTVYGGTVDVTNGKLTSCPYYASYNGEALVGPWVSSMDAYTPGGTPTTGAQVVDLGGAGTEYTLTPEQVVTLLGQNNIWADTGNTSVEYRADTKLYINKIVAALA